MRLTDRWRQRTDHARRTKGDPPPTYAQLEERLRAQQVDYDDLVDVAVNLRKQCDGLIIENARLRVLVGEKTEYVEELAADLAKAQSDPKPTLREERLSGRFPAWPEYTYEATYQPPATDGDQS